MSSTVPTRDNDYRFPAGPGHAYLTRAIWNAVLADLSARMRLVEVKGTSLDELVADLSFSAQARVDAAITPVVDAVKAEVLALADEVATTLASNQRIIDDFQAVTAVNLEELEGQIDAAVARIEVILAGGIPAADVSESGTRVFVTPAQRDAIGAVAAALTALSVDVEERLGAEATARDTAMAALASTLRTDLRRHASAYSLAFGG